MAIVKPKAKPATTTVSPSPDRAAAFIAGAPDAAAVNAGEKGKARGTREKKQLISLTVPRDLLARVDALATSLGQSRAALINLAIAQTIERLGSDRS